MISATYKGITVSFSDAKEEKAAWALLAKLKVWSEENAPSLPSVARTASPSSGQSDGPNLRAWEAETGKRFRFPSFGVDLGWNPADREANAGKMLAMLKAGEIVRTVSGWQLTGDNGPDTSAEDDGSEVI